MVRNLMWNVLCMNEDKVWRTEDGGSRSSGLTAGWSELWGKRKEGEAYMQTATGGILH